MNNIHNKLNNEINSIKLNPELDELYNEIYKDKLKHTRQQCFRFWLPILIAIISLIFTITQSITSKDKQADIQYKLNKQAQQLQEVTTKTNYHQEILNNITSIKNDTLNEP